MTQLGSVPAWMKPQQGGAAATIWANLSRFPMRMGAARMDVAGARTTLRSLALTISEDGPCIKRVGPWGFADTLITDTQPTPTVDGWYPDPRPFVSPYPEQMAWVFSEVVSATRNLPKYGLWKEELFGRMGNTGNAFVESEPSCSPEQLALAVLLEALLFVEKLDSPDGVEVLIVTVDNQIADDEWAGTRIQKLDWSSVQTAWAQMGIDV
ncbi:MAG: hypothetical protein WBH19_07620 [Candidatus Nanopelagicales bacterium]